MDPSQMLTSSTGIPIVNTAWPEIYVPDEMADAYHISQLLYAAVLGAYGWEILTTLKYDLQLVFRRKFMVATGFYLVSRYAAFAYIITSYIFQAIRVPVGSCQPLQYGLAVCYVFASPATSMLFYLRAMAVWSWHRVVMVLLGLCALSTLAGALTICFGITGAEVADTRRCINTGAKPYTSASVATTFANDTAVWLLVSAKIIHSAGITNWRAVKDALFTGNNMSSYIMVQLLRQGALYYFATVVGNIVTLAVLLTPTINPVIRAMLTIPNLALTASMAGRVHRNLIFGDNAPASGQSKQRPRPSVSDAAHNQGRFNGNGNQGQFSPAVAGAGGVRGLGVSPGESFAAKFGSAKGGASPSSDNVDLERLEGPSYERYSSNRSDLSEPVSLGNSPYSQFSSPRFRNDEKIMIEQIQEISRG